MFCSGRYLQLPLISSVSFLWAFTATCHFMYQSSNLLPWVCGLFMTSVSCQVRKGKALSSAYSAINFFHFERPASGDLHCIWNITVVRALLLVAPHIPIVLRGTFCCLNYRPCVYDATSCTMYTGYPVWFISYVKYSCHTPWNASTTSRKNISAITFLINGTTPNVIYNVQLIVAIWIYIVLPVRCWVLRCVVRFCQQWFFLRFCSLLATGWWSGEFLGTYRLSHVSVAWSRRQTSDSLGSIVGWVWLWWCYLGHYCFSGAAPQYAGRYFVAVRCFPQFSVDSINIYRFISYH